MQHKLNISEIFYSIQGESTYAGLPCVFIRLSDCNLRCNYCDAAYTWQEKPTSLEIDEILSKVDTYPCDLVEITGGEPLLQSSCTPLLNKLVEKGKTVLLETNGSKDITSVPAEVICILDVKCPDSGSGNSFDEGNINEIKKRCEANPRSCELKFVLSSKNDYLYARDFIEKHELSEKITLLFSPVQDRIDAKHLAELIMADGLNVRLQLQLHTILWPDISRGA